MPPVLPHDPLIGRIVRLEPLTREHLPALKRIAFSPGLFRWYTIRMETPADLEQWVETALDAAAMGSALPYVTTLGNDDTVIGSTRFMNISVPDGRYEIGSTWLSPAYQRTIANTEAKFLMLRHAFESLGARRVEFKTHALNTASRAAIERIGAHFEGTFRNHMLMPDGSMRDTVWYSIIDREWPDVKSLLEARLQAPA